MLSKRLGNTEKGRKKHNQWDCLQCRLHSCCHKPSICSMTSSSQKDSLLSKCSMTNRRIKCQCMIDTMSSMGQSM